MSSGKIPSKLIQGDDAIEDFDADWLGFSTPAVELSKQVKQISNSSGICCGIVGPWGSGKSSFMRLMRAQIHREAPPGTVISSWFTAWDPGGVQEIGDALLFSIFESVASVDHEIEDTFKELKEALGLRRSMKQRARLTLREISRGTPEPVAAVTGIASELLGELGSSRKVRDCFEWLAKRLVDTERSLILFVDDIDRASGEQIRDLLSELKLYVSHPRIAAILGYDEDYVLKALATPVLPSGIDPKKYLEKIVTVRRAVPLPSSDELRDYAKEMLVKLSEVTEGARLGSLAAQLCLNNPRRLKTMLLSFVQLLSSVDSANLSLEDLQSMMVAGVAANEGFLSDDKIRLTLESGDEDEIVAAFREYAVRDPSKRKEAEALIDVIGRIGPDFQQGTLRSLRLESRFRAITDYSGEHRSLTQKFDWSTAFVPILVNAGKRGFEIPTDMTISQDRIDVPTSSLPADPVTIYGAPPLSLTPIFRGITEKGCVLNWPESTLIVLPTSFSISSNVQISARFGSMRMRRYVERILDNCFCFVAQKGCCVWIIDDAGLLNPERMQNVLDRYRLAKVGLKNPFILQFTISSKIQALLAFLLNVASQPQSTHMPS